jgi:hypothetical protein
LADNPRKWRVGIAIDLPKRAPEMLDEHGNPGLPPVLVFTTRVDAQTAAFADVRLGIWPWNRDPLPVEITGPLHLDREIVELALLVGGATFQDALATASPIVEEIIESLSFEMHYASRPIMTRVIDVTEPVAVGDTREMAQLAGFPLAVFLQSAALGHVEIADMVRLPGQMADLPRHVAAARGWYVKSLSTSYSADQFIFLWIALESLWAKSEYKSSGPFKCRHGHEVLYCPSCAVPTERPVFGLGIPSFLVEECGLSETDALKLWGARQIMHGAVPFDSRQMRELPTSVQVLRAAVARVPEDEVGSRS